MAAHSSASRECTSNTLIIAEESLFRESHRNATPVVPPGILVSVPRLLRVSESQARWWGERHSLSGARELAYRAKGCSAWGAKVPVTRPIKLR